ncbi:MAG TPA: hypothetical protein VLZ83_08115 [Edaphocola sp.]|nr:hypothetical protein [Edaphocola sp.]
MKKCITLFIIVIFSIHQLVAQKYHSQSIPIELSLFNNGSFMPGSGVLGIWSPTVHPGISAGTRFYYKEKQKSELFQTVKIGYFYHRFAQHGVQLYTELGYRYNFTKRFFGEARLGLGYLLSIPDLQVFEFQQGSYATKNNKARSQFMGGLSLHIGYDFQDIIHQPIDLFTGYQFWVQSPFVNGYVPLLPNNSVHLGIIYYLPKKKSHDQ